VRLGAQLCDRDGRLIDLNHARAWLPATIDPSGQADVQIDVPVPKASGKYQLKFDMACEGVDWFEASGSQTTTRPFWVW
jgi:hypothetical protein